jgi:hypothetical protein
MQPTADRWRIDVPLKGELRAFASSGTDNFRLRLARAAFTTNAS